MMLRTLRIALAGLLALAMTTTAAEQPALAAPGTAGSQIMAAQCTATYSVGAQWTTGFLATVTVTNTGTEPLASWTVIIVYPDPAPIIQQAWNIMVIQNGSTR